MMHKRMDYQENVINKAIAVQILADRAGLKIDERKKLEKNIQISSKKNLKRENFRRLANKRVQNAINAIKILNHISNTTQYQYSEKEVSSILSFINNSIADLKKRFKS